VRVYPQVGPKLIHCLLHLDYRMGVYIPIFSRTLIYCLLCFLAGCACIPFLTFKSTAYSIFACQVVRPSLQLPHSNPLLTAVSHASGYVHPYRIQTHCSLLFRMPGCTSIPSTIIFKSTHSVFVSQYVCPFPFLHLNSLLTPFLCPSMHVHFLSRT